MNEIINISVLLAAAHVFARLMDSPFKTSCDVSFPRVYIKSTVVLCLVCVPSRPSAIGTSARR